jgi:hypothetical protein
MAEQKTQSTQTTDQMTKSMFEGKGLSEIQCQWLSDQLGIQTSQVSFAKNIFDGKKVTDLQRKWISEVLGLNQ